MALSKIQTGLLADGSVDTTQLADDSITDAKWGGKQLSGRRNLLMNGGFNVWQRGTSLTGTNNVWGPDRWKVYGYASNSVTVSRQSAIGSISDCEYFMRNASTNGRAWTNTNIEDVRQFHNQTVTLSFWAKTSGATTAESLTLEISVIYDTSGGGSASDNNIAPETFNLTSSWQKFTKTFTFPDMSAKSFGNNPRVSMTIYTPDYGSSVNLAVDYAKFQLEYGSADTPFERRTYGEELQLCQRYLQIAAKGALGQAYNSSQGVMSWQFPVSMRANPSAGLLTGSNSQVDTIGATQAATFGASGSNGSTTCYSAVVNGMSGRTTWQALIYSDTNFYFVAEY